MELISSHTNSLADATRVTIGEKSKADHINQLRKKAKQWRTAGASADIAEKGSQRKQCT